MTSTDVLFESENTGREGSLEFLSFVSDGLSFAIDTGCIMEIITDYQITPLPRVPSHIKGIINLRGQIIPVVDARIRMRQSISDDSGEPCIIILKIDEIDLGLMVDGVSNVLSIDTKDILPPPASSKQELIMGIARVGEKPHLILDCQKIAR